MVKCLCVCMCMYRGRGDLCIQRFPSRLHDATTLELFNDQMKADLLIVILFFLLISGLNKFYLLTPRENLHVFYL